MRLEARTSRGTGSPLPRLLLLVLASALPPPALEERRLLCGAPMAFAACPICSISCFAEAWKGQTNRVDQRQRFTPTRGEARQTNGTRFCACERTFFHGILDLACVAHVVGKPLGPRTHQTGRSFSCEYFGRSGEGQVLVSSATRSSSRSLQR